MNKLFLLLPAAAAGIFLSGCADDPYYGRVANDGPAYRGGAYGPGYGPDYGPGPGYGPDYGPGPYGDYPADYGPSGEIDFYYVGGRPYSRFYGPLVFRDNRYYFSRGGGLASYDVEFGRHHSFRHGGSPAHGDYRGRGDDRGRGDYRGRGDDRARVDDRGRGPAYYGNGRGIGFQQRPGAPAQRPATPQRKGRDDKKKDDGR